MVQVPQFLSFSDGQTHLMRAACQERGSRSQALLVVTLVELVRCDQGSRVLQWTTRVACQGHGSRQMGSDLLGRLVHHTGSHFSV